GDAGELEARRGRDHRRLGQRRRCQEAISAGLEIAQALYPHRAAAEGVTFPEATASPGAVKAAPVCPRAQIQAAGERSRDTDVVGGGLAGVGPSRYCSPLWASQAFVLIQSCPRPQAGHTILAVTAGSSSMPIVSMPVETSRPVSGHLIMMMPMTPPRHFSSINPREHVARVTTADNKE